MSDFDSTFIPSDQSSIQERCTVTQSPRSPAILVIEELATFMDKVPRKTGFCMANQAISWFQYSQYDYSQNVRNMKDCRNGDKEENSYNSSKGHFLATISPNEMVGWIKGKLIHISKRSFRSSSREYICSWWYWRLLFQTSVRNASKPTVLNLNVEIRRRHYLVTFIKVFNNHFAPGMEAMLCGTPLNLQLHVQVLCFICTNVFQQDT